MLSADAPIRAAKDDLLGRAAFASSLAKAVTGVSGAHGFVIAIHGKWGTGKSSVLNLVVEEIERLNANAKSDDEKLSVMRFNPWNFSDQNQLVFQFLKQFRSHLRQFESTAKKSVQRMVDSLDDYADALAPPLELIPYGGKFLASAFKFGSHGARKLLGSAKELTEAFNQLSNDAEALKRRTVVVIDDIDRLNATETRQVFQLVKLTARFPNVVYILAFDRTAVANALKKEASVDSGEEYLEKIVQVSFDLPPISDATLSSFIAQGIESLFLAYPAANFDNRRFGNLFHGGFRSSFSSIRHVRRFLNGLELSLSMIGRELNGVDILGIEALRTFYPRTYETVRANKEVFAGHVDRVAESSGRDEYKKKVEKVLSETGERTEELDDLIAELFPKVQYAFGNAVYGHEWETEWESSYRVATKRYFDAYFQLVLGPSEVSVSEVTRLIDDSADELKCVEDLREIAAKGKLKAAMDSLRFRVSEVPQERLPSLLGALIEMGDRAGQAGALLAGQIPEFWHVRWVIFDVLDRISAANRPEIFLALAERVLAPITMIDVLARIEEERSKRSKYPEFTDDRLTSIREAVLNRIRTAIADGKMSAATDALPSVVYALGKWGSPEEAKAYVTTLTDTDERLAELLDKYIRQTHSASMSDKVMTTHNRLTMQPLAQLMDLETLRQRLSKIDVQQMSDASKAVITLSLRQLEQMQAKGLTPEQFDNSRLFED